MQGFQQVVIIKNDVIIKPKNKRRGLDFEFPKIEQIFGGVKDYYAKCKEIAQIYYQLIAGRYLAYLEKFKSKPPKNNRVIEVRVFEYVFFFLISILKIGINLIPVT